MENINKYICIAIYFVMLIVWSVAAIYGNRRYSEYIRPLDKNKYVLKPFLVIGLSMLEWVKYPFDFEFDKKRMKQTKIIYGKKFAEYYYKINMAEKVTYCYTVIMVSLLFYPLFDDFVYIFFGLGAAALIFYCVDCRIVNVIDKRDESIISDFPQMLSKMALLINAGMIMSEAWKNIADTGDGILYQEMKITESEIENGMSDIDAYTNFGERCGVVSVKKFTSMLVQNLTKGNKELVDFLTNASYESWEEKKHLVRRQGEKASNKLMIPLGLILVGIFVMILVPIVGNLGI